MRDKSYFKKMEAILELYKKTGFVLIATADQEGMPHLAAAGKFKLNQDGGISVSEWFCPGTLANIGKNSGISVTIWDHESDEGYQLTGRTGRVEDTAAMDGYSRAGEAEHNLPQVERRLTIEVKRILRFSLAPHSDLDE